MHAISRPPQSGHVVPVKPTPMPRIEYEFARPPIPDPPQFLPHAYKKFCLDRASTNTYTNPQKIVSISPRIYQSLSLVEFDVRFLNLGKLLNFAGTHIFILLLISIIL